MLSQEDFIVIKALKQQGVYQKDIAEQLGVHPKTVSRALKRDAAPSRGGRPRGSKLDPYKERVDQLLAEGVWNAQVILREIEEMGYSGKLTILREYIKPKRPLRAQRATVRYETEPGRQLQSDWGQIETVISGEVRKVQFIVNQLGYSRRFHFWCTDRQDAEHTYEGLIRSFEYFEGVPKEVLVDNQKAAVLTHSPEGGPRFNPRFADLALWYGFQPRACRPYRARTKGKDERMVGYIKGNFFQRYRSFESWAHLNQLAQQWLKEEADPRFHRTVQEVVSDRFEREHPALNPLPAQRYDTSYRESRLVGWDGYIEVRGNRYSVPAPFVGQRISIRIDLDDQLRIFDGDTLVARHRLQAPSLGWVTQPMHHTPLWDDALRVEKRPLSIYQEVT